ncbi:MAG: SDR family NAD(P)-dependent oxidoreductase, partial [Planctomycetes bacterium]|nr:SDR family NAD(P)-dependent oxidoreductase [Planctomycetota bacterium]
MILITGAAGFIGYHVSQYLLSHGEQIIGIDNINDYYDPGLKNERLRLLEEKTEFTFCKCDIADNAAMQKIFSQHKIERVVHLAAQAGVRYSIDDPAAYAQSNLVGFLNVLECCRQHKIEHLLYASSSSV